MEECNARLLALACSVLGIIMLYVFSAVDLTEISGAGKLSLDDVGSTAKICGNATDLRISKGNIFFQLVDSTGAIRVVIFNNTAAHLNQSQGIYMLKAGEYTCALGQIQEYPPGSGDIEVIAKKVVL